MTDGYNDSFLEELDRPTLEYLRDLIHFAARQNAVVTAPVVTSCQLTFPGFMPSDPPELVTARITTDGYSPSCIVEILTPSGEYAILVTQHSYRLSLAGICRHIYESDPS